MLLMKIQTVNFRTKVCNLFGNENGAFQREIAKKIGVSPSTVSREVRRNKNKLGGATHGVWRKRWPMSVKSICRGTELLLSGSNKSVSSSSSGLVSQTNQWIFQRYESIDISHETIYKWIRKNKNEGGDLYKHCRHRLKHRQRPVGAVKNIPNRVSIRQRPAEADGTRFGDFEMDTIIGGQHSRRPY